MMRIVLVFALFGVSGCPYIVEDGVGGGRSTDSTNFNACYDNGGRGSELLWPDLLKECNFKKVEETQQNAEASVHKQNQEIIGCIRKALNQSDVPFFRKENMRDSLLLLSLSEECWRPIDDYPADLCWVPVGSAFYNADDADDDGPIVLRAIETDDQALLYRARPDCLGKQH